MISIRYRWIAPVILGLVCAVAIWSDWLKMWLLGFDAGRGFFEAYRVAQGQLPYRDFLLQYPPLSTWLLGLAFRMAGSTYLTAQVVIDILSLAAVWLTWRLARKVLPDVLAVIVAAVLALQGANHLLMFSLFVWTPTVLTGMIGVLLLLMGALERHKTGRLSIGLALEMGLGSFVCLLSKPEFMLAVLATLLAMILVDMKLRISEWLLCLGPGALAYAVVGYSVGFSNLIEGVLGYGQATGTCPWWPTGIGIVGALVALGQGAVIISLYSLRHCESLRQAWYRLLVAVAGTAGYVYYNFIAFPPDLSILRSLNTALSLASILLPVMWWSIPVWLANTWRILWRHPSNRLMYLLTSAGLALAARGLFGTHKDNGTSVAVAAFPVLLIVGAYLLLSLSHNNIRLPLLILIPFVSAHFLIVTAKGILLDYMPLQTQAGLVLVRLDEERELYDYIVAHSSPGDYVLNLSYSANMGFAARRPAPTSTTQFGFFAPSQALLDADLLRFRQHPARLVIAEDSPSLGATYGWMGDIPLLRCSFPRIEWRLTEPLYPKKPIPIVEYIRANYQLTDRVGSWVIYVPNGNMPLR
ncbi:MAG: hypothetical protein M1546_05775 [Chloroflexi bacterium]|nr:hypothetical protein [Chloroflexota bacterium]